ncbi:hypothetical protein PENTCL1PPCAC_8564, partial [Pristionchus entomophagus]
MYVWRLGYYITGVYIDKSLIGSIQGLVLKGIHKNHVAIFMKLNVEPIEPSVKRLDRSVLILQCFAGKSRGNLIPFGKAYSPCDSPILSRDSSSLVYLTNGRTLFTINTEESSLLPPLHFKDVSCFYIAGINHKQQLIGKGKCKKSGKYYKMKADLPDEYVEKPKPKKDDTAAKRTMDAIKQELKVLRDTGRISEHDAKAIQDATLRDALLGKSSELAVVLGQYSSKFFNDYVVKKIRGQGGCGCVFEAVNKIDNHEYAVKRVAIRETDLDRGLREVRAMARLDHPGIIGYRGSWIEEPPEGWQ